MGLLTAAGLSEKGLSHLQREDKVDAINGLIRSFLEPAGEKFVEELVFRFLLTRGEALGGSMRNIGGALARGKLFRAIMSTLRIAGIAYGWQHSKTRQWADAAGDDLEMEFSLRGLSWGSQRSARTVLFNLTAPFVKSSVDICMFRLGPEDLDASRLRAAQS